MTLCPQCGKHLLSQASARCNWCGATINDAEYQAQAQTEREAYYRHTAVHDAQSLAATEAIVIPGMTFDSWTLGQIPGRKQMLPNVSQTNGPLLPTGTSARMPAPHTRQQLAPEEQTEVDKSEPVKNEVQEAQERFRHLEI